MNRCGGNTKNRKRRYGYGGFCTATVSLENGRPTSRCRKSMSGHVKLPSCRAIKVTVFHVVSSSSEKGSKEAGGEERRSQGVRKGVASDTPLCYSPSFERGRPRDQFVTSVSPAQGLCSFRTTLGDLEQPDERSANQRSAFRFRHSSAYPVISLGKCLSISLVPRQRIPPDSNEI